MGCGVYWQKVHTLDEALEGLRMATVPETSDAYRKVLQMRGSTLAQIGQKFPRKTEALAHLSVVSRLERLGLVYAGASPGFTIEELRDATVTVWLDDEVGWMAEARFTPASPPIYRSLTNEEAAAFIKDEASGPLIAKVFTKDEYLGE